MRCANQAVRRSGASEDYKVLSSVLVVAYSVVNPLGCVALTSYAGLVMVSIAEENRSTSDQPVIGPDRTGQPILAVLPY